MVVYKGMSRKLKDAVVTILAGIQYDAGSGVESAFVDVLDSTKDAFNGYPAVRVLPNNLGSQTGTNTERDHTVSLAIILHLELEDPNNVESAIYDQMYDLTDLIVDTLQSADFSRQLETIDPTITSFFKLEVNNSDWRVASGKTGGMLFANITCDITYSKDVS